MTINDFKLTNLIHRLPQKKYLSYVLQIVIIGYLLYQISQIGIKNFIASIPINPLFYIIYLIIYISLPLLDYFVYSKKWRISDISLIKTLFIKKVLNTDVIGYSGEFFLYIWANEKLKKNKSDIIIFIKDNNIVSSLSSWFISAILIFLFFMYGYINIDYLISNIGKKIFILLLIILSFFLLLIFIFFYKERILNLKPFEGIWLFVMHSIRILVINILQIIQWSLIIPEIDLSVWFTYSAIQIIISRIPFVPSLDALFTNIVLELSDQLMTSPDLIIGMLSINVVFNRLLNFTVYSFNFNTKKN
jgi:hypothetical protein